MRVSLSSRTGRTRLRSEVRRGFTLIEMLIFIAIFSLLASVVLVAVNPTKNFGVARDTQRRSDVTSILDAIYQYLIKYEKLPPGIPLNTAQEICRAPDYTGSFCNNGADMLILWQENLLGKMPVDPQYPSTGTGTWYWIKRDSFGRVTVSAPHAEQTGSGVITVSR